jgi:hypothetical protein
MSQQTTVICDVCRMRIPQGAERYMVHCINQGGKPHYSDSEDVCKDCHETRKEADRKAQQ